MKNLKGSLILLITAFIWGTAFVAQTSGADNVGAFTFNASRCIIASIFLLMVIWIRDKLINKECKSKWPVKPGILCGVALFLAMSCQQLGIGMYPDDAAASGRAGFLTATYVVMVAVAVHIRARKMGVGMDRLVLVSIIVTVAGMYMLCMSEGISGIYKGDIFELLCALCFTGHIMIADRFSDVDSVKLSCIQFTVCFLLSGVMCLIFDSPTVSDIKLAWFPIVFAGVMSSGVAYTLQLVGQKYAEPAVASIVMSLESVFAALAGCIILSEVMTGREILGCVLVFVAVIIAQLPQFSHKKS